MELGARARRRLTQRASAAGTRDRPPMNPRTPEDRHALDELRTFRKDCGSYVRLYDYMSQVVYYGTSNLEKLAEFLRQLTRAEHVARDRPPGRFRC
ncbi:hypothetical protein GCM10009740_15780 [Terrabacter terrae]|uniref:Uncharacterized protein n=1 Tax=Terrabacter terrae TaxID=318434 RepID=A0ABN2U293_9MICO